MADDAQRVADSEQNRRTYEAIMKASAEVGVPFCLALAMFFTNLVRANGIGVALIAGILTYLAVFVVVKMFFSSH